MLVEFTADTKGYLVSYQLALFVAKLDISKVEISISLIVLESIYNSVHFTYKIVMSMLSCRSQKFNFLANCTDPTYF